MLIHISKMPNFSNLLFLLHFLFILNITHNTQLVQGDDDFIQKTCKNTQYFDLCMSSLKSNPSSMNSDLKGLAAIVIHTGITNASSTYAYLSAQALSSNSSSSSSSSSSSNTTTCSDTTMKIKVYQLCATMYYNANDSLKSSLEQVSLENYDYASMHVMGASAYANACYNAFRRVRGLEYPKEIRVREDGFKHICAVVSGIIDQLLSIDNRN